MVKRANSLTRANSQGPSLRFIQNEEFEDEAVLLLAEYGREHEPVTDPPVPVDEIVELYLKLRLEIKDMKSLFGVDDIHGALWVNDRLIGIDQRFDPEAIPAMRGRYRFTLAHETGHWRLHRKLFQRKANQHSLLPDNADRPEYICRSSDTSPIEYQANRFASCLLMPREMLKRAWHEMRGGTMDPLYLSDLQDQRQRILLAEALRRSSIKTGEHAMDDMLLENVSRPLAEKFEVSPEAMRIRLEGMKLLRRQKVMTLFGPA